MRKKHSAEFKAKVVLETLKNEEPINAIAGKFEVHPVQVSGWRKQVMEGLPKLLEDRRSRDSKQSETEKSALYEQIGKLKMELEWLKKKCGIVE